MGCAGSAWTCGVPSEKLSGSIQRWSRVEDRLSFSFPTGDRQVNDRSHDNRDCSIHGRHAAVGRDTCFASQSALNATGTFSSETPQLAVEIPLDVNLQKAWKQSRLDHLFERFGKCHLALLRALFFCSAIIPSAL